MVATVATKDDLHLLWEEYKQVGDTNLRNQIVERYLWLVRNIVNGLVGKGFAKFIGRDEIEAAGNYGLMQAVEGFDLERGIKFETYAPTRIRGAILDWLRDIDWIPRKVRSNARLFGKAVAALQDESGQKPSIQDIANYLNVEVDVARALKEDAEGANTHFQQEGEQVRGEEDTFGGMPALDQMPDRKSLTPLDELTESDDFDYLIACLTDREQIIVTLYYRDDFTMARIGMVLGLSESRISQAHDKALLKIKDSFL